MAWSDIQKTVGNSVRELQQLKLINATISGLFGSLPVVGSFLSEYWKAFDDSDEKKAALMENILVTVGDSQDRFERFEVMVAEQGEQLKALQHLRADTAAQVIAFNLTVENERERSRDLIEQATSILQAAGKNTGADDYFRLGYANLAMHRPDDAKACFLEALDRDPKFWRALLGIANVYQVQGNTMIRQGYLQAAEDALREAGRYAEDAAKHNLTEAEIHNQLGYNYGTLARSYASPHQKERADKLSEDAKKHFRMALAIDPSDASAENGLGGVALHQGDYDEAIKRSARATVLNPRYLFAFHDLTLAYYKKVQFMPDGTTKAQRKAKTQYLLQMLESYKTTLELDGQIDAGTLPPAAREALVYYGSWALSEATRLTAMAVPRR